jgi:pimeloyl-ACP methyl ester carboxylesterase
MRQTMQRATRLSMAIGASLISILATAAPAASPGDPPPGFVSAVVQTEGTSLHYVRGGHGPAVILIHGFPEDWVEYREIMPRLAAHFTVIAIDLPGIGKSAPAIGGYDTMNLAGHVRGLVSALRLERPYIVGHDLGGLVTYGYVRRFPDSLRGATILDVPIPGLAGWDEAVSDFWHIRFIQEPGQLAEKLVVGRQAVFLGRNLDIAKFSREQRDYYIRAYGEKQLHAAFEIYRAFPKDAEWNAQQTTPNSVSLTVAVGERSFFARLLPAFVEGYRAKGMTQVESAIIPTASHYVLADNPGAVAELIEQRVGRVPQ